MNKDRLLKWEQHLRGKGVTHNIGHRVFDISIWNSNDRPIPNTFCGTSGCAIGELPFVFPDEFSFNESGSIIDSEGRYHCFGAERFFGIDLGSLNRIIYSDEYELDPTDITPQIVADRILEVIKDLES